MRLFAAAFLCGVIALQSASALPDFSWGLAGVDLLAGAWLLRDRRVARALVVLVAGIACGYGYAAWRAELRLADAPGDRACLVLVLEWLRHPRQGTQVNASEEVILS